MRESAVLLPRRFLGLELSGAKNQKTTLAAIEYYPKEKKIFLLDIYDHILPRDGQSNDEALLELIEEIAPGTCLMGVNVPLELPPCLLCARKTCTAPAKCSDPAVKWMRQWSRKVSKGKSHLAKARDFTPYTQRPIELWIKYKTLEGLPEECRFDVDETLGGNKGPLAARMHYLKRYLEDLPMTEVWPKLSVAILARQLRIPKRELTTYRRLEEGLHARGKILETLVDQQGVFIYDRDLKKLAANLTAFDAFICAYTAMLADLELCEKPPAGFPLKSGWVHYPKP